MGFCDVDLVRNMLEEFPQWNKILRWNPFRVQFQGRWCRVSEVIACPDGVDLVLPGGMTVRLSFDSEANDRLVRQKQLVDLLIADHPGFQAVRELKGTDRVRHQSGAFLRLLLKKHTQSRIVLAADQEAPPEQRDRMLVSLVLWWDQLKMDSSSADAHLYVPAHWQNQLKSFLQHLQIPSTCWVYTVDDRGSLDRRLLKSEPPPVSHLEDPETILPTTTSIPDQILWLHDQLPELDLQNHKGQWELSFRGFPLIWSTLNGYLRIHPGRKVPVQESEAALSAKLELLLRERTFPPRCPLSQLYTAFPERWLESLVLKKLPRLVPGVSGPVYAQVPTYLDNHRKVLDLLTRDADGRLVVMELKVEKELGLIFQALDYWRRVKRHLQTGDFKRQGYFPGLELSPQPPRILLVAPLFEFHPVLPVLKQHLGVEVRFECVGVSADWRREFQVLSRFDF